MKGWTGASAALLSAALVVGVPSSAHAHNYLVSSTPEAGSTITELPEQFVVTTNEPLLTLGGNSGGFALTVQDESGAYYGDGCLTVEGSSVSTPAALGAPGEYTVAWQVVSGDGHTVSDQFAFQWEPAGDHQPSEGSDAAPVCGGSAAEPDNAASPETGGGDAGLDTVLWIGGALLAVGLAAGVTTFVLRRAKRGSA